MIKLMEIKLRRRKRERERIRRKNRVCRCLIIGIIATLCIGIVKGNEREITGYVYTSGDSVWAMAEEYCPREMDVRTYVREIEKVNNIKNAVVYENAMYKMPIYE